MHHITIHSFIRLFAVYRMSYATVYCAASVIYSFNVSDFQFASGSITINTTDVDVTWNKLQAEVCGLPEILK